MTKEKKGNLGLFIFIGIIIIANLPFLIPFVIFGIIIYVFITKNNGKFKINKEILDNKLLKDIINPELYQKIRDAANKKTEENSEIMEDFKEDEPSKSKITRPIEYENNYDNSYSEIIEEDEIIISEPVIKKQNTHKYDLGKSIWDDYETVVDKLNNKQR